ncbi:LuxR C-terminal-related transcriptional regulator [Enterobacteriaceae bacterium H11S18]|uniref:response regulator transcription factor n=1 Tax=Dryocola clanedunensis TaxID=2925396 RepID=UPI0022F04AC5|nr:LuxR C-terminal-related transcriptional regulator [Dryocola clanedunensis]MCT4711641.1 LuxR C-terminal-related transcriptional regulator [Dryocola clanedunensis]
MTQYIYLVDDDEAIRLSISALLSTMGWETKAYDSVQHFQEGEGDWPSLSGCLLLDIRMPGKSGLALLECGLPEGFSLPVIMMTGHGNIDLCRRAFKNGAFEFLTKPVDADLLIETVSAALEQQRRQQLEREKYADLQAKLATLSAREQEVMALIMQGKSNKEMAKDLNLSPRTVEAHRASLFARLEINSLAKLINIYGGLQGPDGTT